MIDIPVFLQGIYEATDLADAGHKIFDTFDRLMCDGEFDVCETIFQQVDPTKLPSALRRSFLSITGCAKDKIPARAVFYAKALSLLTVEKSERYAVKVLGGLK